MKTITNLLNKILYIPVILFTILISPVMLCFGIYMLIMFNRSWKRAMEEACEELDREFKIKQG